MRQILAKSDNSVSHCDRYEIDLRSLFDDSTFLHDLQDKPFRVNTECILLMLPIPHAVHTVA